MNLISIDNVEKVKTMLLNNCFDSKHLNLHFKNVDIKLKISNVSINEDVSVNKNSLKKIYFLDEQREDNVYCMTVSKKQYKLFLEIGHWSDKYRVDDSHIILGTNYKLGDHFVELELSQALEDNKNIYITKNISRLAGEGAISRINSGLKNDRARKIERRNMLVSKLNSEVISFENNELICINKIKKYDLDKPEKCDKIFFEFMKDLINYAFTIEEIVASD